VSPLRAALTIVSTVAVTLAGVALPWALHAIYVIDVDDEFEQA
jgi:hypothetical protein